MLTKDKILEVLDKTDRHCMDEIMDWLKGNGFFMAPASTNFHGNYEGGLDDGFASLLMEDTAKKV